MVYSLLPWQQHKQLIQLIAWLKMLKLCHMFVLYVFFLYAGRQLYVIFDWNRAISVDYCTIFAKILISVAMVTKMIIIKNKNIFSCSYIITFLWYQNQPNWLTIMWSHLHDFYLNRYLIWAIAWDLQQCGMCDQQSLRSACTYAQSDQSLC